MVNLVTFLSYENDTAITLTLLKPGKEKNLNDNGKTRLEESKLN